METNRSKQQNQQKKSKLNNYAKYTSIAIQMIVIIVGGVFGGYKLDQYLELKFPIFTLVFSLLAVGIAIYLSIKDFIKTKKD